MKPLKGINLDISPDNQPQATYRIARNWIYDSEFDALAQEQGSALRAVLVGKHVVGAYGFEDGDMVLLCVDSDSETANPVVLLYRAALNTTVQILADASLDFARDRVYDIIGFENGQGERMVLFTDNVAPPRIINIDIAVQPAVRTTKLFPDIEFPTISLESKIAGVLTTGTYYAAVRYRHVDGSLTNFSTLEGPYYIGKRAKGFAVRLTNLDSAYTHVQVALLASTNTSIEAKVYVEHPITSEDVVVPITGGHMVTEVLLDDLTIASAVATRARTATLHRNRIYLGNTGSHEETLLQTTANSIEPTWKLRSAGLTPSGPQGSDDPHDMTFMPDEVYAFYVAWVRDDGSLTKAYTIPGRDAADITVTLDQQDFGGGASTETATINPLASITSIVEDAGLNTNDRLSYLKVDRTIFESDATGFDNVKYYQSRCTATVFDSAAPQHGGRCGLWQNANETYPDDFPGKPALTFNGVGTATDIENAPITTLASTAVRHHRMPSIPFLKEYGGVTESQLNQKTVGLKVEFKVVNVPEGYQGVVFYAAKRNNNNNLVISNTPLHFGAMNGYSLFGSGSLNLEYSTVAPFNGRSDNQKIFDPSPQADGFSSIAGSGNLGSSTLQGQIDPYLSGTGFTSAINGSVDLQESFKSEPQTRVSLHDNVGLVYSRDLLSFKPFIGERFYIKPAYTVINHEEADLTTGRPSGDGRFFTMNITASEIAGGSGYIDSEQANAQRRAFFDLTSFEADVNVPPAQMQLKVAEQFRYVPANAVDEDLKFDNRYGAECAAFRFVDPSADATNYGYGETGRVQAGKRGWYSYFRNLNFVQGSTTNTYDNGWRYDTIHVAGDSDAVQRTPLVSIVAYRTDCYQGYSSQDLVQISNTKYPANDEFFSGVGSTVDRDDTTGDVHYSTMRYRVTSGAGFNSALQSSSTGAAFTQGAIQNQGVGPSVLDGTIDAKRGTLSVGTSIHVYSAIPDVNQELDEQYDLSEYEFIDRQATPEETNNLDVLSDYMRLNNWRQPLIDSPRVTDVSDFPYRIMRSDVQQPDSPDAHLRRFAPLNYHEQTRDRGEIINLHTYQNKLIIHHRRGLFVTIGQEKIATTAGEVTLGDGDIFRVPPTELLPSEYGYAGVRNPLSCTMTPGGYFFVDQDQRKVFLYDGNRINEVSNKGMRSYFDKYLQLRTDFTSGNVLACHSFYPGVAVEYDPRMNRVIVMIRNNRQLNSDAYTHPLSFTDYNSATAYEDRSRYVSYSMHSGAWVSEHDYTSDFIIGSQDSFFSLKSDGNTELHEHHVGDTPGVYLGKAVVPSTIDVAIPTGGSNVHWQSVNWQTKVIDRGTLNYGHVSHDLTFERAAVYNDLQCSGELTFVRPTDIDYDDLLALNQTVTLRSDGTKYHFNGFRDLVDDTADSFLDEDYEFIEDNLNANKDWYDKRRFISQYIVVRLITPTNLANPLYLYSVDAKARRSFR